MLKPFLLHARLLQPLMDGWFEPIRRDMLFKPLLWLGYSVMVGYRRKNLCAFSPPPFRPDHRYSSRGDGGIAILGVFRRNHTPCEAGVMDVS